MERIGILFDLDGTLLDTLEDLADATNHVLAQFGFPGRTLEEVRQFVGNGSKGLIRQAIPAGTAPALEEEVFQAYQVYYRANCQNRTKAYPGIPELLEKLKAQGYPMAIVSNKPDLAVKKLAEQYFPGLYARGESADCPRKPAPDMVFRAARALGRSPEHCIYVGDSEVDVITARNAGMPCASVLWGFRDEAEIRANGGEYFCNTAEDLYRTITELEKKIHGL